MCLPLPNAMALAAHNTYSGGINPLGVECIKKSALFY
jgi:hypothetical protein